MKYWYLLTVSASVACTPGTPDTADTAEPRFSIASALPSPMVGEPLALVVSLRNTGRETETVARRLAPEYGATVFFITGPDGQRRRFSPFALKELVDATQALAPGATIEDSAELFHDGKDWVFKEPGTYRIEAVYQGHVAAEPISITVAAPRTDGERAAAGLLIGDSEAGLYLLVKGGENLERGRATVTRVADSYPTSIHASHANLVLGADLARAAPNFRTMTTRPAAPAAAAARLRRVDYERLTPSELKGASIALSSRSATGSPELGAIVRQIDASLTRRYPAVQDEVREQIRRESRAR